MELELGFKDLFVFIPIILMVFGFVYMNFIFNRKIQKEEKDKAVSVGRKGRKNGS
jgi:hypothetical protein